MWVGPTQIFEIQTDPPKSLRLFALRRRFSPSFLVLKYLGDKAHVVAAKISRVLISDKTGEEGEQYLARPFRIGSCKLPN